MTDDLKDTMHVIDLGRVMNGDLYHGEDSGVLCVVVHVTVNQSALVG